MRWRISPARQCRRRGIAVVAARRDSPAVDCYFPWYYIRDRIESGERGSVKLENLPTDILNVLEVVHP